MARRLVGGRKREDRQTARDRAVARRLYRTFERDLEMADLHGIHFYVQYGTVALYGMTRHELDRDLLISLVRQVPGVKGVISHLQVVDPRLPDPAAVTLFDHTRPETDSLSPPHQPE